MKLLASGYARVFIFFCCSFGLSAAQRGPVTRCPGLAGVQDLFQISTLDALTLGIYDGAYTIGQLKQHGNFGLGTFEGLDGEMVVLDGHYYHFRSDGTVSEAENNDRTPFAAVTYFRPDLRFTINNASMTELGDSIDQLLPSKNLFYAIRVHGNFTALSTRAIPKQSTPYPPLDEAVLQQSVFTYRDVTGTAVALRCPAFVKGINQVDYHFHFVSDDIKVGGHALSLTTGPVVVEVQILRRNSLWLPDNPAFLTATLPISQ